LPKTVFVENKKIITYIIFMPSKNSLKKYIENGYYHIYNRGHDERIVFLDDQDYKVFLRLLKLSLTPKNEIENADLIRITNRADSVELISYCLMPNHFHLLLKQIEKTGMENFMRGIMTAYVKYFNKKYERMGSLFQGRYKAISIEKDEYLTHLSRYIHMNPVKINPILEEYPYSSYKYYLNGNNPKWLKSKFIMDFFSEDPKEYKKFIEDKKIEDMFLPEELILEN